MSDGGKGSNPRPISISNQEYTDRWNAIFGNEIEKAKKEQALDKLVRINEELGLYDEYEDKTTRNNEETQEVKIEYVKN